MYKAQQCIDLNLKRGWDTQLSYQLDTAKGDSGSPVIFASGPNSEIKVIGIHGYGVREAGVNMATSLGHLGNDPNFFRSALDAFENPVENGDSIVLRGGNFDQGCLSFVGNGFSAVHQWFKAL